MEYSNSEHLLEQAITRDHRVEQILVQLRALQDYAQLPTGMLAAGLRCLVMPVKIAIVRRRIKRRLRHIGLQADLYPQLDASLVCLQKIAGFGFFERLFAAWHTLHMPIFFLLVITGFTHVWAVHRY